MATRGKKHICLSCGMKFYDLGRTPVECPKCGALQQKPKTARVAVPPKEAVPPPEQPPSDGEDDDKADEDLLEDASDLGEDDDDLGGVMEHMDGEKPDG